jgi:hypothetical protein
MYSCSKRPIPSLMAASISPCVFMGDLELFPPPVLKIGLSAVENSNNREREYSRSQATRWERQRKAHGAPKDCRQMMVLNRAFAEN